MQISALSTQTTSTYSDSASQLTDEQLDLLKDILSQYDPGNLSAADKKSLMEQLRGAGIRPTKEVRQIISSTGFQMPAPPQGKDMSGPPPGPPPTDSAVALTDADKKTIADILAKYDPDTITETDTKSLLDELRDSGVAPSKEVGQMLSDAGFALPAPPQGGTTQEAASTAAAKAVSSLFNAFLNGQITEAELREKLRTQNAALEPYGVTKTTGTLFSAVV